MGVRFVTLSAIVVALILAWVVIWFGQRSLMYFPDSHVPAPVDVGLPAAEVVRFRTTDGLDLTGWFVRPQAPPSGYTVIVFNGNAGNRAYRAPLARALARRGLAVFLFDYRGYGNNPGLPHEEGLARDARAALTAVESRPDVDPARVVYFGESLGTGVAVRLAVAHQPAALILRSPFTSFVAIATRHYPFLPARYLLRDRYASIDLIERVRAPLLVIAGDADRIVPFEESEALFDRAGEPKRFVVIEDADHNDAPLADGPAVIDAVAALLRLPESVGPPP